MNVLRLSLAAVASGFLAVALWWLSRDGVMVLPPVTEPPVEGMIERVRSTTWLLLAATASAGVAMVLGTLAALAALRRQDC